METQPATRLEPKTDMERAVQRLTHRPRDHFFGYYDKYSWDATGR